MKRLRLLSLPLLWAVISLACSLVAPGTATGVPPTAVMDGATPTLAGPVTPAPAIHGKIAYGSDRGGTWQIVVMNADGSDEYSLTESFGAYTRPSWSPDGTRIGMRSDISSANGIAVMDLRHESGKLVGSQPVALNSDFSDGPSWAPDGTKLVYSATQNNSGWLTFISDISTGSKEQVTGIPENATDPTWSRDGNRIVYAFYSDPTKQIRDLYLVNVDGSGMVQLTNTPDVNEMGPAWSPDGSRIAFTAGKYDMADMTSTGTDIFVMNADGSNVLQLTTDPGGDFDPAWSPDGTQIAFTSDRNNNNDGNYEIYLVNADGTGEMRLTNNTYTDRWPSWRAEQPEDAPPAACQNALTLFAEVTIPGGTRFTQSQDFTKVWRVQNSGTCTWTPTAYSLRSVGVDNLAGPVQMPLPGAIQPGALVDLAVTLTAPETPGTYGGVWQVIDPAGQPVMAPDGTPSSLPVSIEVLPPGTSVLPRPLYFMQGRTETPQLWRLEMDGVTRTQITHEEQRVRSFSLAKDGRIAVVAGGQLIIMDRDGGNRQVLIEGEPDINLTAWSPDGGRLAYGRAGIRIRDLQSGADTLLIADNATGMPGLKMYQPVAWSPDGSKLLARVYMWESGAMQVISVPDGAVLNELPLTTAIWSLDSQSIYYAAYASDGMMPPDPGLWRAPASGGSPQKLNDSSAWWPAAAPDGSLNLFIANSAGPLISKTEFSAQPVRADANGVLTETLGLAPFLIRSSDGFTVDWTPDASAFLAQVVRPAMDLNEVLYYDNFGNGAPPVYLMSEIGQFDWGQ